MNNSDDVIRGRRLTDRESNMLNYPDLPMMDDKIWNEILAPFIINEPVKDKWFELLCYYNYQTEMYDRALTNLRSPYDETEAYIVEPEVRESSTINAINARKFVLQIAKQEGMGSYNSDNNKYHFSAQGWIDEYLALKKCGKLDWLEKYM